jgi:hypothetical protein
VGQVVEDEDEVGLDERRGRRADRVALGQRDGRLERRDRVVGERADRAAGEPRHALGRLDAAARDEARIAASGSGPSATSIGRSGV